MEEILNRRAKLFLKEAENDIKNGFFDLAAFHLEQALQLKLKYILAKKIGYFSKTHFISTLFEEVKKIIPEIYKIYKKYKEEIEELEIAYIGARYLPIEYSKEKVKKLLKVVKEIFRFLEKYD